MKLFVVLATLSAVTASPLSFADFKSSSSSHSSSLIHSLEPSLPEGCTFISNSKEESADGVITGEYSYKDPIGSTITVIYSVNADGTDYTESRKILKAYETDKEVLGTGLITVTEVVQEISTDLKPTVISIIKRLVLSANIDLGNSASFVDTIMVQLRPVVQASVNTALATSQYQHLSANDLIEQIIINLRPFVVEALRREVIIQQQSQSLITVAEVVEEISTDLKPTVIRIIKQLVASANINLGQTNTFVNTIMIQLRPVVSASVNNALATSKYQHLSAEQLIEQITIKLRPFVVEALRKEVIAKKPQISQTQVVNIVIDQLRETIITIIKQTVSASSFDVLNNEASLVNAILSQLEGVVLRSVQTALKVNGITTLNDNSLTAKIILEITPFVKAGVSQQVEEAKAEAARLEAAANEAARREAAAIEAARIEAARIEAARKEAARLEALQKEAEEAARRKAEAERQEALRKEAEEAARRKAEAERAEAARLEALRKEAEEAARLEALRLEAIRIEAERKEAARLEAIRIEKERQEAARLEAERAEAARLTALLKKEQELVSIIIKKLEPIVIRVIRTTVRSSNVDLDNYQNLAVTISTQLRPVVFAEVSGALRSSQYRGIDADDMTNRIIIKLKPFIEEGIKSEVTLVKQQANAGVLITKIIGRLRPIVIQVIQSTLRQQNIDLSNNDQLVTTIITGLRPVVLEEVRAAIASTGATYLDAEDMATKIIVQLRPFIIEEIYAFKQKNTLQPATASTASQGFLTNLRPIIQKMIIKIMQTSGKGITDQDRLVDLILGQFKQGFFLGLIKTEVQGALGANAQLPSLELIQNLLESLRPQIRLIVVEEIFAFRQKNTLSAAAQQNIINGVVSSLRSVIKQATAEYLQSSSSVSDANALATLLAQLQPIVIQTIEKQVSGLEIFQSGAFQSSDAFAKLLREIMVEIRLIITQEIQLFRREQARIAAAARPVPVAPTQTALVSIFGTGKGNSVKVDTPDYKYNYAYDKRK